VAPHLHYEVHKDGRKVNPAQYYFNDLTPEQYEEMLKRQKIRINLLIDSALGFSFIDFQLP